ncbi:hypothetical protein GCM10011369_33330 [Neiella marina]|uniref:Cytochrome oxidase Cu insertion factor, SCO1/SenC/PrrC family n=1 Tax=Neiella marina TaxID=508461 RepID=A0A8J2U9E5_9GAMM|nr:hypothetical protein [Neiella marina]GGA88522.1 hypothetical protein GCM10011369_33330 [Neiella marina]
MTTNQTRSRRSFLLVLLAFAAPVFVAWLILKQGWFTAGVTSHGQMVTPPLQRAEWRQQEWQNNWALIGICQRQCDDTQGYLQRIKTTLGQYQQRVVVLSVGEHAPAQLGQQLFWRSQLSNLPEQWAAAGTILIMDPLGHVMLTYPPLQGDAQLEQIAEQGKGVKADLYKMLKLSRIG